MSVYMYIFGEMFLMIFLSLITPCVNTPFIFHSEFHFNILVQVFLPLSFDKFMLVTETQTCIIINAPAVTFQLSFKKNHFPVLRPC